MTITFYATCRSLRIGTQRFSPKELLKHGFPGLGVTFRQLTDAPNADGRLLYEITAATAAHRLTILDALQMYGVKPRTLGGAAGVYEEITGQPLAIPGAAEALYRVDDLEDLDAVKAEAVDRVNTQAGEQRRLYMTDIPGQEGTYLLKGQEAAAYAADPSPEAVDYPYLAQEAADTDSTLADVAALVAATAAAWTSINKVIEGRRRGGLVRIAAAADAAAVAAVFPIVWPDP